MHIHRAGRTINMAGQVAGNLRQSLRQKRAERQRNPDAAIEEIGQCGRNHLSIAIETAGHNKIQNQIEIGVVAVMREHGLEGGRQVGVGLRTFR